MSLQDPDGGQSVDFALRGLRTGMKRCSDYMDEVCVVFGEVIETAQELELALTKEAGKLIGSLHSERIQTCL